MIHEQHVYKHCHNYPYLKGLTNRYLFSKVAWNAVLIQKLREIYYLIKSVFFFKVFRNTKDVECGASINFQGKKISLKTQERMESDNAKKYGTYTHIQVLVCVCM